MSREHILAELRSERGVKIQQRDALQSQIEQLTTAIDALEGRAVAGAAAAPKAEISVTDAVEAAIIAFPDNEIFDAPAIKARAIKDHPEMQGRITRGIYNGINAMLKHGLIVRCPGGFCRKALQLAG